MSDDLTIQNGHVATFHYTLTNESGEVLDSSSGGDPLAYLHGAGNIVPGLERQMTGLKVGDKIEAIVPPAEGYGEYQQPGPQAVPRTAFPPEAPLELRMTFHVESDGHQFPVWITKIEDDQVWIDANHPLAGVTLKFDVEVTGVRLAEPAELAGGHPGAGAHAAPCCAPDGTCSNSD